MWFGLAADAKHFNQCAEGKLSVFAETVSHMTFKQLEWCCSTNFYYTDYLLGPPLSVFFIFIDLFPDTNNAATVSFTSDTTADTHCYCC